MFNNKTVLVTGGTGTFGKQFISKVIADYKPKRLVIFSRDEMKQFMMEQDFPVKKYKFLRYSIGDVRDPERLKMALRDIDIVIHAAAIKIVPTAEYNPMECVKTNIYGAENVVNCSIESGVKKVLALSTDKAVNPINLYGASKLAADKIFIAANKLTKKNETSFSVVRYGNVVGSRGSIINLFSDIAKKKNIKVPITHKDMTRFFITADDAVKFVLQSLKKMKGTEIFVPKISSFKITDLANVIVPNRKFQIIGIRPGEKIHESLCSVDESRSIKEFNNHYIIYPARGGYNNSKTFEYNSKDNKDFLNQSKIKTILNKSKLFDKKF